MRFKLSLLILALFSPSFLAPSSFAQAAQTTPAAPASSPALSADAEDFSLAARRGDTAKVKALLDRGVDVNTKFRYDVTALSYACDRGYLEIVNLLLDRGADVNVRDKFYNASPLNWASSPASVDEPTDAHVEIVRLLLEKGAQGAEQVLTGAARSGNLAMAKVVLDRGGVKPEALTAALSTATTNKHEAVAEALRAAGAKPPMQVDASILATYAGKYRSEQTEVEILVAEGKLVAVVGPQRSPLMALDTVTFQPEGGGVVTLKFQSEGGKVTHFVQTLGSTNTTFKRVEEKQP
ncbi:MAG: ankyrin repeat domain-containing protein [Candidatus Acidiferrales bacterium]